MKGEVYRIRGEKVEKYIVLAQIGFYLPAVRGGVVGGVVDGVVGWQERKKLKS